MTNKRTLKITISISEAYMLQDALREYAIGLKSKSNGVVMRDAEFLRVASERRQDNYIMAVDLRDELREYLPR